MSDIFRYFKPPERNIAEKLAFFVRQGVTTKEYAIFQAVETQYCGKTCFFRKTRRDDEEICDISSRQNAVLRKKGDYLSTLAPAPDTIFSTSLSEAIDVSPGVVIASAPCATP